MNLDMTCRGRRSHTAVALSVCLTALSAGGVADAFQIRPGAQKPRGPLPQRFYSASWSSGASISSRAARQDVQTCATGTSSRVVLRMQPDEKVPATATSASSGAAEAAAESGPETSAYHPKAGETDHNPSLFEPGGGPTVLLDDPPTDVYEKAIGRTLIWVAGAAVFAAGLWTTAGGKTAEEFVAGYLVEQSLSVDNLFVFLLLFDYFKVPLAFQDRVLNWGIYGAIVMRAVLIGLGAAALQQFHAILLVFAAILVYSSASVLLGGEEEEEEMGDNTIVQFSRKIIDSVDFFDGDRFFTMVEGVKKATPLFICMIAVEISDVVFAVDSIPAVFGVTENPMVVFTSNMFAIMGLRSLYTILSKAATDLEYLEPAVAVVLGFIGSKMIAEYAGYNIPTENALAFVATVLAGGVGLSIWSKNKRENTAAESEQ